MVGFLFQKTNFYKRVLRRWEVFSSRKLSLKKRELCRWEGGTNRGWLRAGDRMCPFGDTLLPARMIRRVGRHPLKLYHRINEIFFISAFLGIPVAYSYDWTRAWQLLWHQLEWLIAQWNWVISSPYSLAAHFYGPFISCSHDSWWWRRTLFNPLTLLDTQTNNLLAFSGGKSLYFLKYSII